MFESPLLDRFTRVHPIVPVLIFAPAIGLLLGHGIAWLGLGAALAWALGGYVFWTLTEYWLHRVVFHFEPDERASARACTG